jgi:hypothetical protein
MSFRDIYFLIRPGYESSTRSVQLIRRWGLPRESAPGQGIGDEEVLRGSHFGWVVDGFSWWVGGGKRKRQVMFIRVRFSLDDARF